MVQRKEAGVSSGAGDTQGHFGSATALPVSSAQHIYAQKVDRDPALCSSAQAVGEGFPCEICARG